MLVAEAYLGSFIPLFCLFLFWNSRILFSVLGQLRTAFAVWVFLGSAIAKIKSQKRADNDCNNATGAVQETSCHFKSLWFQRERSKDVLNSPIEIDEA